jgi:hypothetical protein
MPRPNRGAHNLRPSCALGFVCLRRRQSTDSGNFAPREAALKSPIRQGSVGSRGDSHVNTLDESFHGLYGAELIRHGRLWQRLNDVELTALAYVDWINCRQLHGELMVLPPVEHEGRYAEAAATLPLLASQQPDSLRNPGVDHCFILNLRKGVSRSIDSP